MTATVGTRSWSSDEHPYLTLFLVSFVILFFQLACIRWFASTVVFMTFFTNVVLMACFLGMSLGCLTASRKQNLAEAVIPLALITIGLSYAVLWAYRHFGQIVFDVGGQRSPQQIYSATEYRPNDPSRFIVPIEAVAGFFYVLIAAMFVGLGQVMGRAFDSIPNRVGAYSTNIAGSLIGIAAFALASYLRTTPFLWFAISLAIVLYFVPRRLAFQAAALGAVLATVALTSYVEDRYGTQSLWSPYYKIRYDPSSGRMETNNIGHQRMVSIGKAGAAYVLPYLLNRDTTGRPFEDILIIGAGSGNDVQAALSHGARHIDAVEIDPVLNEIGRRDHPNRPYDDPRVTIHYDDGRSFVRKTDRQYNLIVYALVDSLVLHSGYSSLRLESFLFTDQAFRDIRAKLKPGGVFAMYNSYRQGWVVGRLDLMAQRVFESQPLVVSLPYKEVIKPTDNVGGSFTLLLVGNSAASPVEPIRARLQRAPSFWLHPQPSYNEAINGFSADPPQIAGTDTGLAQISAATVDTKGIDLLPSDDWPFLYLREAMLPGLNIRGWPSDWRAIARAVVPAGAGSHDEAERTDVLFGAGFMLLETKGVVHLALLFGSTWVVNSIVFFTVLLLILLANLFVWTVKPVRLAPYYTLLIASLLLNAAIPMSAFLALPGAAKVIVSCTVVFVPIFFAGVIFATAFRDSRQPDVDLGANIGGVILGGLSQYPLC